jgi:hypothetical protein
VGIPSDKFLGLKKYGILSIVNLNPAKTHGVAPKLTSSHFSPPRAQQNPATHHQETTPPLDSATISAAQDPKKTGLGLFGKLLTLGMATAALAGCTGSGPAAAPVAQQVTEPIVLEMVSPANPYELMRMEDGSVAISADLKSDDAYVVASRAAIRQDGGENIAFRTSEGTTLCQQAQALGGTCLNEEQVVVEDPGGSLLIETFARPGESIHRLEAKHTDGSSGGVDLNKLPDGTEVFSDNGSGLLRHNGDLQMYPGF